MNKQTLDILLVEDDELARLSLMALLGQWGRVDAAENARVARSMIEKKTFALAFVDLDLESEKIGLELIAPLTERGAYVVVLSGREEDEVVEAAYRNGCRDFLTKPYTQKSVQKVFSKFSQLRDSKPVSRALKQLFLTHDSEMEMQLQTIELALRGERPIFITGESGVGKTHLAKFIHQMIDKQSPFVHINCAEIPESMLEAELFGFEKGAFTGAHKKKKGLLELADGGVVFLDEIATMPMTVQKKLLKVIEEKTFFPLGSERPVHSQFRLISATCENLEQKIAQKEFRSDLYFRIEGFNVHLKPLRERKGDLKNLIEHFIKRGERRIVFDSKAQDFLQRYSWPGNLRELARLIEMLQVADEGIVTVHRLKQLLKRDENYPHAFLNLSEAMELGLKNYLEKLEVQILNQVMQNNRGRVRKTLSDLKLANNAYYRILENAKKYES